MNEYPVAGTLYERYGDGIFYAWIGPMAELKKHVRILLESLRALESFIIIIMPAVLLQVQHL